MRDLTKNEVTKLSAAVGAFTLYVIDLPCSFSH